MKALAQFRQRFEQLRGLHQQFGDLAAKERWLLFLSSLALLGEILFQVLLPLPMKYIFDGLLMKDEETNLFGVPEAFPDPESAQELWIFVGSVCGATILIAMGLGACSYYQRVWGATAGQRMVFKLRKRLYEHLHRLPLRFHQGSRLGDLLMRITGDIGLLRDILSGSLIDLVGRMLMVVVFVSLLFLCDPFLALISLTVVITVAVFSRIFGSRIVKVAKQQREQEGILAYTAGETLSTIALVKAYGREKEVVRRFARQNRASMRKGVKGVRLQAGLSRWVETAFGAGTAAVIGFGALRVIGGGMLPGDLVVIRRPGSATGSAPSR